MANKSFPAIRGRRLRATRLDGCGRIKPGPCSAIVTSGFITISVTSRITEPTAITLENAAGENCFEEDAAQPRQDGQTLSATFCEVNPEFYAMLTTSEVIYDGDGNAVGYAESSEVVDADRAVAIEVWQDTPGQRCAEGAEGAWGYHLWPFLQGGVVGDFEIANSATTFQITGLRTMPGNTWGNGPYDVEMVAGLPGPLSREVKPKDFHIMQVVGVAPPAANADCIPSGPEPTGATAQPAPTPGLWTPADSYPAPTFADMTGIVATPLTAWTAGQYVLLGDGTKAHWTGAAWAAGPA